jgi:hypothetical protein
MVKMQSSTTTIIALLVAGVLLFIAPLATLTDRNDNVAQANIQLIVEEFVTEVKNTGKITRDQYQEFEIKLDSTGSNSYDVEMQIQHIDDNVGKKNAQANYTKIGENVYYSEYTTQILKQLGIKTDDETIDENADTILLKEGDIIYVSVKNSNSTAAQTLKSSFLGFSNAGEYVISASSSGMITVNGVK